MLGSSRKEIAYDQKYHDIEKREKLTNIYEWPGILLITREFTSLSGSATGARFYASFNFEYTILPQQNHERDEEPYSDQNTDTWFLLTDKSPCN